MNITILFIPKIRYSLQWVLLNYIIWFLPLLFCISKDVDSPVVVQNAILKILVFGAQLKRDQAFVYPNIDKMDAKQ